MNYDEIDLEFTFDGDFARGDDGDLKDTSYDLIQSKIQEIQSLVRSDIGDWKANPNFAGSLDDFRGEPNIRSVGEKMQQRLFSALVSNRVVAAEDLDVRVVPTGIHEILIMIKVNALSTNRNSLELGNPIIITTVYNSVENSVWFVPQDQRERDYFFRRT